MPRSTIHLLLLLAVCLTISACRRQPSEREVRATQAARAAKAPEATRQHLAYLDRLRQRDPFNSSIERSLLTDQSEAGVVLSASIPADKVAGLMQEIMKEMAQKFPHEDISLTVFASSAPTKQIGIAHLSGQTEETSYAPVR
jgi:hypothetical protein